VFSFLASDTTRLRVRPLGYSPLFLSRQASCGPSRRSTPACGWFFFFFLTPNPDRDAVFGSFFTRRPAFFLFFFLIPIPIHLVPPLCPPTPFELVTGKFSFHTVQPVLFEIVRGVIRHALAARFYLFGSHCSPPFRFFFCFDVIDPDTRRLTGSAETSVLLVFFFHPPNTGFRSFIFFSHWLLNTAFFPGLLDPPPSKPLTS